jgi:hypothetical protein
MGSVGELSLPAVDILWEDLKLGAIPFPLEVPGYGDTAEERARIRTAVYGQLESRGLAHSGRPTSGLATALRLLAAPNISIDLVALARLEDSQPIRAVVGARGKNAVLAVQSRLVTVSVLRETQIVGSIVNLLPPNRSGPGQSISLPASLLGDQPAPRAGRHRAAPARGVLSTATRPADHATELRFLQAVLERPLIRAGTIGVLLRDEHGKIQRLPGIGFFDTDQGRYTTSSLRGPDGEDWTTLTPTDNARLTHRLTETLVTALRQ